MQGKKIHTEELKAIRSHLDQLENEVKIIKMRSELFQTILSQHQNYQEALRHKINDLQSHIKSVINQSNNQENEIHNLKSNYSVHYLHQVIMLDYISV